MSGELIEMKRDHPPGLIQAYVVIAALVALVDTFNIFTTIHDGADRGIAYPAWEPTTWEYTSGIATMLACGVIYVAIRIAPPGRSRWPRFAVVHGLATLLFSSLHILLMNAMRVAIYAARGSHYPFARSGFLYEYRKDLIAYIIWAGIFWLFTSRTGSRPRLAAQTPPTVDIRDGRRLLRVAVDEVVAVRAAGNYVEFLLADGRRPLARMSLTNAQSQLGGDQFVRTHRSWAVNAGHIRELRAVGGGDYQIELAGGVKASLSRRFPDALTRIRTPCSAADRE